MIMPPHNEKIIDIRYRSGNQRTGVFSSIPVLVLQVLEEYSCGITSQMRDKCWRDAKVTDLPDIINLQKEKGYHCSEDSKEAPKQNIKQKSECSSTEPKNNGWLQAIDEEMVSCHLAVANSTDTYEEAKKKLNTLIDWHVQVATDPSVNGGWQLVPKEPTEKMKYAGEFRSDYYGHIATNHYKAMLEAAPKHPSQESS